MRVTLHESRRVGILEGRRTPVLTRGASPLGLPDTLSRAPLPALRSRGSLARALAPRMVFAIASSMRSVVLVVPGRLDTRTGGYEPDRRLVEALRNDGWWVDLRELSGAFPTPTAAERDQAARVLANLPGRSIVVVDGLALGALPDEIERAASRLPSSRSCIIRSPSRPDCMMR